MTRVFDTTTFAALGTACTVKVVCAPIELPLARMAAIAARAEIVTCERVLSRFDPSSDLSRVNSAPGAWTTVDVRLVEAVDAALWFERETDGRCSPLLLRALTAAGYDRSFEQLVPRPPRLPEQCEHAVDVDRARLRVRVTSSATLDLGGTAKGLIAARALRAARRCWPDLVGALVDLGGDIAVTGAPPDQSSWVVGVEDPRATGSVLGAVRFTVGGVATSGSLRRRFGSGLGLHHLIDPDTRAPASGGPLAVTVVAPDPVAADGHATALAITPVDDAAAYVANRPGLGAVLALEDRPPLVLGTTEFVPRKELVG